MNGYGARKMLVNHFLVNRESTPVPGLRVFRQANGWDRSCKCPLNLGTRLGRFINYLTARRIIGDDRDIPKANRGMNLQLFIQRVRPNARRLKSYFAEQTVPFSSFRPPNEDAKGGASRELQPVSFRRSVLGFE